MQSQTLYLLTITHLYIHNCVGVHHLYLISLEAGTSIHLGLKSPGILLRSVTTTCTRSCQGTYMYHIHVHVPALECNTATHIHPINKVGSSKNNNRTQYTRTIYFTCVLVLLVLRVSSHLCKYMYMYSAHASYISTQLNNTRLSQEAREQQNEVEPQCGTIN